MSDDKTKLAALLRDRAARVRAAAEDLARGADASARPDQEPLLRIQARILRDGAARLEDEALAVQPVSGNA